ncbi:MAG: response regulator [Pirellulaceae bacterium]
MQDNTVAVLLVEDDDIDAESVARAFKKQRIANPITRAHNGLQALEILRGSENHPKLSRPYLILLDLNMPKMSGLEFLEEVRNDASLRDSIVFVLTTSDADRDKLMAYEKNVAGYIVKSRVGEDFVNLVNVIDHYWRYVEFPPEKE